ncbi:MAG TPA: lipid A 3-O-deacylase [Rhodanobacteraceae bacterium]|nr:lipid A 3-O-deacylase [Rhodanobacteraceae bacterium]
MHTYHPCLALAALALATALPVCGPAHAAGFAAAAGPSVTTSGHVASAAFVSVFGWHPANHRIHFEPLGTLGWVSSRHTRAADLDHEVFFAAGGVRVVSANHHWFLGEQLAVTSARTDALSSRFEFMTGGGWEDGHFVVMLRHVSNAHLLGGGRNLGETMLLAGVRF